MLRRLAKSLAVLSLLSVLTSRQSASSNGDDGTLISQEVEKGGVFEWTSGALTKVVTARAASSAISNLICESSTITEVVIDADDLAMIINHGKRLPSQLEVIRVRDEQSVVPSRTFSVAQLQHAIPIRSLKVLDLTGCRIAIDGISEQSALLERANVLQELSITVHNCEQVHVLLAGLNLRSLSVQWYGAPADAKCVLYSEFGLNEQEDLTELSFSYLGPVAPSAHLDNFEKLRRLSRLQLHNMSIETPDGLPPLQIDTSVMSRCKSRRSVPALIDVTSARQIILSEWNSEALALECSRILVGESRCELQVLFPRPFDVQVLASCPLPVSLVIGNDCSLRDRKFGLLKREHSWNDVSASSLSAIEAIPRLERLSIVGEHISIHPDIYARVISIVGISSIDTTGADLGGKQIPAFTKTVDAPVFANVDLGVCIPADNKLVEGRIGVGTQHLAVTRLHVGTREKSGPALDLSSLPASLKSLTIRYSHFPVDSRSGSALGRLNRLETLRLEGCDLTPESIDFIQSNLKGLQKLILSDCTVESSDVFFEALGKCRIGIVEWLDSEIGYRCLATLPRGTFRVGESREACKSVSGSMMLFDLQGTK